MPIETNANCTLFARRDSLSFEYWRICSWQNGHPNDRVSTINDTPPFDEIRLDMEMGVPSRRYTVDFESASLGLMVRACGEGAPVITEALPHSHDGESLESSSEDDATARRSWTDVAGNTWLGANPDAVFEIGRAHV